MAKKTFIVDTNEIIPKVRSQANPPATEAPTLSEVRVNIIVPYDREFRVMIFIRRRFE